MTAPAAGKLFEQIIDFNLFLFGEKPVALVNPHSGIGVEVGGKEVVVL